MAIALVASTEATGPNGGTSASIDTTGATLLVAHVAYINTPTVSDSKGNTWTALTAATPTDPDSQIFYVANPTVGSGHTFTISGSTIFATAQFAAFSGAATTSPFDQQNGAGGSFVDGGVDAQPGSITPSEDGELIIAGIGFGHGSTVTIGGGFTITDQESLSGGNNFGGAMAYLIQTTATAVNPMWDGWSGTEPNDMTIASFKAAAGGTDATANPAVVALAIAQPATQARAGSSSSPSAAALVVAQPSVQARAGASRSPSVAALTLAQPAAQARAGSSTSPAAAALTLAQPAATPQAGTTTSPAVAALVLAVPAATASAGTIAQPATATLTLAQPAAAASAGSSSSPAVAALTMTQPAATASASGNATPTPGTVALTITQPAVTAGASATVTTATAVLTFALPAASATGGASASPQTVFLVFTPLAVDAEGNVVVAAVSYVLASIRTRNTTVTVEENHSVTVKDRGHTLREN